jgi:hypothetical protein
VDFDPTPLYIFGDVPKGIVIEPTQEKPGLHPATDDLPRWGLRRSGGSHQSIVTRASIKTLRYVSRAGIYGMPAFFFRACRSTFQRLPQSTGETRDRVRGRRRDGSGGRGRDSGAAAAAAQR